MKLSMKQKDIEKLVVDLKSNYNIYAEQNPSSLEIISLVLINKRLDINTAVVEKFEWKGHKLIFTRTDKEVEILDLKKYKRKVNDN